MRVKMKHSLAHTQEEAAASRKRQRLQKQRKRSTKLKKARKAQYAGRPTDAHDDGGAAHAAEKD